MDVPFILLAAGQSSRMGQPKALQDYHGQPWLRAQIEAIRAQTQGPIRVVLGPQGERESQLLEGVEGVQTVLNPAPQRGPFSSLQVGLEGLPGPVFVGPLDCPVAPVLRILFPSMDPDDEAVVPTHQGRGGHPVLIGPTLVGRLLELEAGAPEARLDLALKRSRTRRVEVEDARILLNLNTSEAWQAFQTQPCRWPQPKHPSGRPR